MVKNIRVFLTSDVDVCTSLVKQYQQEGRCVATVEAEFGEVTVQGDITLAHHGKNAGNPAPCNRLDVPVLVENDVIVISHLDLDTLGGVLALQGRKPVDDDFWAGAEFVDVYGMHHEYELSETVQNQLDAFFAYQDSVSKQKKTDDVVILDVTDAVNQCAEYLEAIIDTNHVMHTGLIDCGKIWKAQAVQAVEDCLVYENSMMRIFDSDGPFCAASYYSLYDNCVKDVTVSRTPLGGITVAFCDGGKKYNARKIVQMLWGQTAGGHDGIAGSPRGVKMSDDEFLHAISTVGIYIGCPFSIEELESIKGVILARSKG